MNEEFRSIGHSLVSHAKSANPMQRGVVTELFPFIYEASKRMSTRAISEWLEKERGLKVSFVTIAKALREEAKYWTYFVQDIETAAWVIEQTIHSPSREFLFNERLYVSLVAEYKASMIHGTDDYLFEGSDFAAQLRTLENEWFVLEADTRRVCAPYIEEIRMVRETNMSGKTGSYLSSELPDEEPEDSDENGTIETKNGPEEELS